MCTGTQAELTGMINKRVVIELQAHRGSLEGAGQILTGSQSSCRREGAARASLQMNVAIQSVRLIACAGILQYAPHPSDQHPHSSQSLPVHATVHVYLRTILKGVKFGSFRHGYTYRQHKS